MSTIVISKILLQRRRKGALLFIYIYIYKIQVREVFDYNEQLFETKKRIQSRQSVICPCIG